MFDLSRAIALWRLECLRAGITSPEVLDELESHLREELEQQSTSGTISQHSFDVAVQNLGKPRALRNEFKKINRRPTAVERLMIGICVILVALIILLSGVTLLLGYAQWPERLVAATAIASVLIVALGWKRLVSFLPVISHSGARWAAGLACIASGFILSSSFCNYILPHFESGPDHQLPAIGPWAVLMIAVFSCAGIGLLMSERERRMWGLAKPSNMEPKNEG